MAPASETRSPHQAEIECLRSPTAPILQRLAAAGWLLRADRVSETERELAESALAGLSPTELSEVLSTTSVAALRDRLRRGAEEAFEVAFAQTADEREMWTSAASEALRERDRVASLLAAAARWPAVRSDDDGRAAVGQAVAALAAEVARADRDLRSVARSFTAVNSVRRRELERLAPAHRSEAWWYADRATDDDLLLHLAGESPQGTPSAAVVADLAASRLPPRTGLAEASRINAEVDALIEEL